MDTYESPQREILARMEYPFSIWKKQLRPKWRKAVRNAEVGDLVSIREKNLPRLKWSLGTIEKVIPSIDGLIRKAVIKPIQRSDKSTTEKERERAVHDLILLKESLLDHDDEGIVIPGVPEGVPDTEKENGPTICRICTSEEMNKFTGTQNCPRFRAKVRRSVKKHEKCSQEQNEICTCPDCLNCLYPDSAVSGSGITIL